MEKESKFKIIGETPYGPILERVPDATTDTEGEKKVSPSATPLPEKINTSRRNFLGVGLATAGAVVASSVGIGFGKLREDIKSIGATEDIEATMPMKIIPKESSREKVEVVERTYNSFEKELMGYKAFFELKKDEVLFVDENNVPVGGPIKMRDFVDTKYHKDGRVVADKYRFSPGKWSDSGVLEAGIAGEWIQYVRELRQAEYPNRPIARCLHATGDFAAAANNTTEPGLAAAIAGGKIKGYKDLVGFYANKPVVGAEELTRVEYVQQEMQFAPAVPAVVQTELRQIIPGLCAQESKFNNGLTSPAGARGIFRFMPETWAHYGGLREEITSLKRQVEIAGAFFSDLYQQLQSQIDKVELSTLRAHFSDEESFERDLLVPLMVNSYNAGAARIGEGVKRYLATTNGRHLPKGKDLFLAIVDFSKQSKHGRYLAAYGPDARAYVPKIYAQAAVLQA